MNKNITLNEVVMLVNNLTNKVLYLAQSSLTEFQFRAFRKLTLDFTSELIKTVGKDRCGSMQNNGERGGVMSG